MSQFSVRQRAGVALLSTTATLLMLIYIITAPCECTKTADTDSEPSPKYNLILATALLTVVTWYVMNKTIVDFHDTLHSKQISS